MNKGFKIMFLVLIIGLAVAFLWNKVPAIKNTIHLVLDPTVGKLLGMSPQGGFVLVVLIFSLITSLLQKFTIDADTLKAIKVEQKMLQEQMKEFKNHPEKMMELNKKQLEMAGKTMDITTKPALFTALPFILFFRWFGDYFTTHPTIFFGFMSWIWAFILLSIIFSMILRKLLKLP